MRDVHEYAKPVAGGDHLLAEGRKPAVHRTLRRDIAQLRHAVMNELQVDEACFARRFQALQVALEEVAALRRDHDPGRAPPSQAVQRPGRGHFDESLAPVLLAHALQRRIEVAGQLSRRGLAGEPPSLPRRGANHGSVRDDLARHEQHAVCGQLVSDLRRAADADVAVHVGVA